MKEHELTLFFAKIKSYYPNFCKDLGDKEIEMMMESWLELLEDIPLQIAKIALKKHTLNSERGKWIPNIADIRQNSVNIVQGSNKTSAEAWDNVIRSIRLYGWYDTNKALNIFDPTTKKTVKAIGYRNLCSSTNIDTLRSQFTKMYDQFNKRNIEEKMLPKKLKQEIQKISNNIKMIGG